MIASAEEIIPGLRQHITYRQEGSPATFARYASTTNGSIYGPATGQKRLTIKTPIKNLYVAGSGVMGGGVEAAAASVISGQHFVHGFAWTAMEMDPDLNALELLQYRAYQVRDLLRRGQPYGVSQRDRLQIHVGQQAYADDQLLGIP